MSDIQFTPFQQKVFEKAGGNLLIPASAGSGKTTVVIERLIRQIKSREADLEQILVVTFTDAAANEMKMRITEQLNKLAGSDRHIAEQIEKLSTADISTLHSFCSKLIRKYFFELKLDPAFSVAGGIKADLLRAKALDKVIKEQSETSEEFNILSEIFLRTRNFEKLKQTVLNIYDFVCSLKDREDFLNNTAYVSYSTKLDKNPAAEYINKYLMRIIGAYKFNLKNLAEGCAKKGHKTVLEFCGTALNILDGFKLQNGFVKNFELLDGLKEIQLIRAKFEGEENESKERYGALRAGFLKTVREKIKNELNAETTEELKDRLISSEKIIKKLVELVKQFDIKYRDYKQKERVLDFNDLEEYTLILLNNPTLLKEIKGQYKFIYVDEYQDINDVQESILQKLSGNNLIMVGDIKQSIYGFRNSSPKIFLDKILAAARGAGKDEVHRLTENFRSNPAILKFVNSIFEVVMTEHTCGVNYKDEDAFILPETSGYTNSSNIPAVSLTLIGDGGGGEEEGEGDEQTYEASGDVLVKQPLKIYDIINDKPQAKKLTGIEQQAYFVANKIKELTDGKKYYDAKQQAELPITYKNIAILCRDRNILKQMNDALGRYKIPLNAKTGENIYDNPEILLLLSFLRLINNKKDDISWAACLLSPFIGLTEEDLAVIKNSSTQKNFYECISGYILTNKNYISKKIIDFTAVIASCGQMLTYGDIYDVLVYLDNKYNILNYYLMLPDGRSRYKLLSEYINSFAGGGYGSLYEYLDYVTNLSTKENILSAGAAECSVTLSTMHMSKGLEYNVVFAVGLNREFSKLSTTEEVVKSTELGLGFNYYGLASRTKQPTLAKFGLSLQIKQQEFLEEMRLLYVALTRAKNYLFLVANADVQKIKAIKQQDSIQTDYNVLNIKSHLGFITACFAQKTIGSINAGQEEILDDSGVNIYITDGNKINNTAFNADINFDAEYRNQKFERHLEDMFNYKYKYEQQINLALKNSVTHLLEAYGDGYESFNESPRLLSVAEHETQKTDYAKLGSAYHLIMEQLDFNACTVKQTDNLILKLNKEGRMDPALNNLINQQAVIKAAEQLNALGLEFIKEQQFMLYVPYNEVIKTSPVTDKILIQGVIDLIIKSGEEYILVDYKTTKAERPEQLTEKYKIQMQLYKMAAEKYLNTKIKNVYIYSFHFNRLIDCRL